MPKTVQNPTRPAPEPPDAGPRRLLCLTAEATFDVEAVSGGAGGEQRTLPRFRMVAYTGAPMRIAGWRYPVVVDLAGMNIPSQARPIRFSHDPSSGVGHTDSIRVESGTLVATGLISRDTPAAREVVVSSKNGFPWQASIGSTVEEFEFVRDNQKVMVNGREYVGPVNVVRKSTLGEISFVDLGADGQTSISVAAAHPSHQEHSVMDDVNSTTHVDTNAATPAPAPAPGIAPGVGTGKPASPQPAPGKEAGAAAGTTSHADAPLLAASAAADDIRAHALAETQRIADVRRVCTAPGSNGQFASIEAQAIREGWDATRTELEVLRASRPKAPMVYIPGAGSDTGGGGGGGVNTAVLEAACVLTAGSSAAEKQFDEQTLDAASKRFRGGIGLQELLLEAAWANGYTGRNFRDSRAVLRHAFNQNVQAGFSTIDIGGILSNVANKFLLEGFFSVERTWRNICSVRNVSDFKTVTSYRLIGKDQYEKVAPGGELKHGTLGEESYSNKADTYGLLLSIDRRDIINDDLGAITTVPRKLGRGSGLKINDVFWATFLDNAAFFTAALKNYLAGADTALSIDGLTKGEVAFMDQVDAEGKPIGIMPAILLAPTALSALGTTLWKSLEIRDTTASTKYPIANPHVGKFRVEVSRYLSNSQYTGNSSKAWYLLADPNDLSVIEVAFLNGQESPTIETAEADFNVLGVQMRGYHDFGVALQEPRGGVKAKGEA